MSVGQPIAVDMTGLREARNQHQQKAEDRRQPHPEGMGREEANVLTLLGHRVQSERRSLTCICSVKAQEELAKERGCIR